MIKSKILFNLLHWRPKTNLYIKFYYSWDEELSWEEKKISDEKFLIRIFITEATSQINNFIIYDESMKGGVKKIISIE